MEAFELERGATVSQWDERLIPFLRAPQSIDDRDARRSLDSLLQKEAWPLLESILRKKSRQEHFKSSKEQSSAELDYEDMLCEAQVLLLTKLQTIRGEGETGATPIRDFLSYVAQTAYSVYHHHLRKKYPQRAALAARLRYLLEHQEGMALWKPNNEQIAGFKAWEGRTEVHSKRLTDFPDQQQAFIHARLGGASPTSVDHRDLMAAIFNWLGHPVELQTLVNLVAHLTGVSDQLYEPSDEEDALNPIDVIPSPENVADTVFLQQFLLKLWEEVALLPVSQRAAVLLNLRDDRGKGVIALLPILKIASIRKIAEALEIPAEKFAALWNELPIEDQVIAELLNCSREQVIGYRRKGRERLARRMAIYEKS